jgi:hypothetical protein
MVVKKEFIVVKSGKTNIPFTRSVGQGIYDVQEFDTEEEAIKYIETHDNRVSDYQIFKKFKDVQIRSK